MEDNQQKPEEKKVIRYTLVKHRWPDEIQAVREKRVKTALIVFFCVVCFLAGNAVNKVTDPDRSSSEFQKLDDIYDIMANEWYFGKDIENLEDTLINNSILGMTSSIVDPHTTFMSAEESQQFTSSLQGNFVGIGIQYFAMDNDTVMVERVFKNSGAQRGGMMKGDVIHKVDGVDCAGKTLDEISEMIKGEENTNVTVQVIRENQTIDLEITRSIVNDSVYGFEKDGAGILEINSFAGTSGKEVGKYLADFKANGIRNIIIDLRDNGGGYVDAAKQIGSYFLPEDSIIYQEQSKDGTIKEYLTYKDYEVYSYDNIVILVNGNTASASEVLTSSLSEQLDNVSIVGVKTYGKGTVQLPHQFEDGSSLKFTIAEWLTPKGKHINNVGITPDIEVALDPAVTTGVAVLDDGEIIQPDSVSSFAKSVQTYLKFLGYSVDRSDEYFSIASSNALRSYQTAMGLEATGEINEESIQSLLSSCALKWHAEKDTLDYQMIEALAILQ